MQESSHTKKKKKTLNENTDWPGYLILDGHAPFNTLGWSTWSFENAELKKTTEKSERN